MAKGLPARARIAAAGRELKENPPTILTKTRRKKGKAAADQPAHRDHAL